jgi:hypothetical protein
LGEGWGDRATPARECRHRKSGGEPQHSKKGG